MKKWSYVAAAVLLSGIVLVIPRLGTAPTGSNSTGARLDVGAPRDPAPATEPAASDDAAPDSTTGDGELTPREFLEEQLRLGSLDAFLALAKAYRDWAPLRELGPLRREILEAIARHESPRHRVGLLLTAAAEDAAPPEDDPNWELLLDLLAPQWDDPGTYALGRDLVLLVESERARRLVVDSLVRHVEEAGDRVTPESRADLVSDLIDAYFRAKNEGLKSAIRDGVALLSGEDVAGVLVEPDDVDEADKLEGTDEVDAVDEGDESEDEDSTPEE